MEESNKFEKFDAEYLSVTDASERRKERKESGGVTKPMNVRWRKRVRKRENEKREAKRREIVRCAVRE